MESRPQTNNNQDIEANAPTDPVSTPHARLPVSQLTHLKACVALMPNALVDSLYGIDSLATTRFNSRTLAAGVGLLAGSASLGFNEESLIDNSRELRQLMQRKHPDDWPLLSWNKNFITLGISAIPISLAVLLHSTQLFFKIETLPDTYPSLDVIPSEVVTTVASGTAVLGGLVYFVNQGIETLKAFRKLFAPPSEESKVSITAGIGVAGLGMVVDFMLFYLLMKYVAADIADRNDNDDESDIDLEIAKYFYLLGAGIQGITNFCYNKSFGADSADRFLKFIFSLLEDVKNKHLTVQHAKQIFSFIIAMVMSGLLASLEKQPADNGFRECATDFQIPDSYPTDITIEILTWVTAAYLLLINTASLYDVTFNITNWTCHQINRIKNAAVSAIHYMDPFTPKSDVILIQDAAQVPLLEDEKNPEKAAPFFSQDSTFTHFKRALPPDLKKTAAEKSRDRCCTLF